MKIKQSHYDHMKAEINAVLAKYPSIVSEYEAGNFPRADKVKDLQRRFCFDLSHGAGLNRFISTVLYEYMNDNHVYTALKRICPTVTRNY